MDLFISFIWIILSIIRGISLLDNVDQIYYNLGTDRDNLDIFRGRGIAAEISLFLWALQSVLLGTRLLVLFQTTEYFGVIITMIKRLLFEMVKFMIIVFVILIGFSFGFYYIFGGYEDNEDFWEAFKFLFTLMVGVGDFDNINDFADQLILQIYIMFYTFIAIILLMNLLVALLTTWYEIIHDKARTESSFAIASAVYDLSHLTRIIPAPLTIHIFIITLIIHILNFIPSIIWPAFNIYNYINTTHYNGFINWKIFGRTKKNNKCCPCIKFNKYCKKIKSCRDCTEFCFCTVTKEFDLNVGIDNNQKKVKDLKDTYELTDRIRIIKYYLSGLICCKNNNKYKIYHKGCYSCIPTKAFAERQIKDKNSCHGYTLNEYAKIFEEYHKYPLDLQDTLLSKQLTVNTIFCKQCYKPFDQININNNLLTPFWALTEIISIYLFIIILWLPLIIIYTFLTIFQFIKNKIKNIKSLK